MSEELLYFNGLNGATGHRLLPPMFPDDLIRLIEASDKCDKPDAKDANRTVYEKRIEAREKGTLGLIKEKVALDLEQAGWGIIYHPDTPDPVRKALAPLISSRKGKEFTYEPNETSRSFRARHKQGVGVLNPDLLPYYLLIAASPAQIPFHFQYTLDAAHAAGRLYFDEVSGYEKYVESVLEYESATANLPRERRVAIFSPRNPGDDATASSSIMLAAPLAKALNGTRFDLPGGGAVSYLIEHITGSDAEKKRLLDLLTRSTNQPALIFTATHGLGYPKGDLRQMDDQGAMVCQEWPGPETVPLNKGIPDTMYLAGRHLPEDARFDGLITFSFACYSAGTPQADDFSHLKQKPPVELADKPFVARLPQRLLSQGALAFIGHVDRTWDFSYLHLDVGNDITTFKNTIEAILTGAPVGHALEHFNDRYIYLSQELTESNEASLLYKFKMREPVDKAELTSLWMARNNARAYIIFGDPAVRIKPSLMP